MESSWSDNPLVRRAVWGSGQRLFGRRCPRFLAPLLAGLLIGLLMGTILVQINLHRWHPIATRLWLAIGLLGALGYACTIAVLNVAWSRTVRAANWLEELYLTRLSTKAVAHGLLLEFLVPHIAFATGLAFGLLVMVVIFFSDLDALRGKLPLSLVAGGMFVAPYAGIVMRNTLAYGWRLGMAAYEMSSGWNGLLRMTAVIFALMVSLLLLILMSGVVSALTISLMFCIATGDGAEGYLPQFADDPLFQEVDFL